MTAPAPSFDQLVAQRRDRLVRTAHVEVLDERGHPVPPAEVVRRLPPSASIKWVPAAGFYGTAYFGLFNAWPPNDKRWERVRAGEYPEKDARDLVQMFPRECRPEEMAAYVEQRWGTRREDPRIEADRLTEQAAKLYKQAEEEKVDAVIEKSNERSERETDHSLRLRAGDGTANAQITVPRQVGDGPKRLI